MSLCPYLLSLLTACYMQLCAPLGEKEWILQAERKIQKLIKSMGEEGLELHPDVLADIPGELGDCWKI